jgi:hypothetical protein
VTILLIVAINLMGVLKKMRRKSSTETLTLAPALGLSVGACDDPVKPPRHPPIISSLTAFPAVIDPGDSILVTCEATDADGDSLVYDWLTDGRLRIKGNQPGDSDVFNSPSKTQIFYHVATSSYDSAWVECTVRDRNGGNDVHTITIQVNL